MRRDDPELTSPRTSGAIKGNKAGAPSISQLTGFPKGCFPDLKSNIQVSVLAAGHYVVSKPYLIFLLVLTGNPNPFRVRGAKKARFFGGVWGHIEYLNILIFKSFD